MPSKGQRQSLKTRRVFRAKSTLLPFLSHSDTHPKQLHPTPSRRWPLEKASFLLSCVAHSRNGCC